MCFGAGDYHNSQNSLKALQMTSVRIPTGTDADPVFSFQ